MNEKLEKPKIETNDNGEQKSVGENHSGDEQEEALVALVEHRIKEVEHIRNRISHYKSQLEQAEKKLEDSQSQLARFRSQLNPTDSKKSAHNGLASGHVEQHSEQVQPEQILTSPVQNNGSHFRKETQLRPQHVTATANSKVTQPLNSTEDNKKPLLDVISRTSGPTSQTLKGKALQRPLPERATVGLQNKGTKRKFEQKEHKDLISSIRSSSSPCTIRSSPGILISSQHNRKLRSLAVNPVNDQLFVTSALDGVVNLWQLQAKGPSASLLSTTDCASPKLRRWAEDISWHPQGDRLVSVYTADNGDSQISILNLNSSKQKVKFLEEKPHVKGIINSVSFMPWEDLCFVTGGSDHALILWDEKGGEDLWKPRALHRNTHSSAVMGVAGLQHKKLILSVGADKRIIGFDVISGRVDYRHQIESKCMGVLSNPSDFNLFMVQTGNPGKQLRLFDIRLRQTELHAFGWKQHSSESQSALINQAWSPDGWYITSGSTDPIIHIFDIRYNSPHPCQSIKAHQKRVFKAVWHHCFPLLITISSDLNIGLHKIY